MSCVLVAMGAVVAFGCHSNAADDTPPGCDAAPTETESWGTGCAHGIQHLFDNGNGRREGCTSGWLAGSMIADCDVTVTHIEIDGAGGEYAVLRNAGFAADYAPGALLWHGSLPGDWESAPGCFSLTVDTPFTLHKDETFWLASYGQRSCLIDDADVPGALIFDGASANGPWSNPGPAGSEWAFPVRLRGDDSFVPYDATPPPGPDCAPDGAPEISVDDADASDAAVTCNDPVYTISGPCSLGFLSCDDGHTYVLRCDDPSCCTCIRDGTPTGVMAPASACTSNDATIMGAACGWRLLGPPPPDGR
jgi:hypothetical protein